MLENGDRRIYFQKQRLRWIKELQLVTPGNKRLNSVLREKARLEELDSPQKRQRDTANAMGIY
jgi:hypothetical protein